MSLIIELSPSLKWHKYPLSVSFQSSLLQTNLLSSNPSAPHPDPIMYSTLSLLLCLVALFTSTTLSLPLGPSSGPSLVTRQEENAQRKLFCHYNPSYCQGNFPQYCTDPNPDHAAPWWCSGNIPPAALIKRAPQDPEREEPEEEDPHPVERSWCKKHPNHPYCYSQFCIDHPGSC
jgi:hypothetical protein